MITHGDFDAWVIEIHAGRNLLGRPYLGVDGIEGGLSPVFELTASAQSNGRGAIMIGHQVLPVLLLPSIQRLETLGDPIAVVKVSSLSRKEKAALLSSTEQAIMIQDSMRAEAAGISVPTQEILERNKVTL